MYERDLKKYLAQVGRYLICSNKQKRKILKIIKASATDFIIENNILDLDELNERFGKPEDVAKTYLPDAKPDDIIKAVSKKKVFIIAIVIALVIFAAGVIAIVVENNKEHGYIIVEGPANEITDNVGVHDGNYQPPTP